MAATHSHPVFAITFAVTYAISTFWPSNTIGRCLPTIRSRRSFFFWSKSGGWTIDVLVRLDGHGGLGALFISAIVARLPAGLTNRLAIGLSWAIPLATMGVFVYLMKDFFFR